MNGWHNVLYTLLHHYCSVARSRLILCHPMNRSTPGLPVHHQLLESTQTHVHWVSDAIQPSHPLSSPSPPALSLSQHQGLLQWVSSSHQVAKYWSFTFSISPSSEYSGLISFRIDWFDFRAVQGIRTPKSVSHFGVTEAFRPQGVSFTVWGLSFCLYFLACLNEN